MSATPTVDFARVENNAVAGRLIARSWQPVALSRDCVEGHPKRIKIIGSYYTLYRGVDGRARLTQDRCPHRGTSLAYGWVEGNSIRCRYHGWKFDGEGHGQEFPAESMAYARAISLKSYPVREYLGAVFAYLGDGEPCEFPRFPELEDESRGVLMTQAVVVNYNFFQRVENDHDEAHVFFTHRDMMAKYGLDTVPKVSVEETEYGMVVVSTRPDGRKRVGYAFMPNVLLREVPIPQDRTKMSVLLGWRVPIDDTTTFSVMISRVGNFDRTMAKESDAEDPAAIAARVMRGEITLDQVDQNHPLLPVIQDTVSLAGQGVIADRSAEHLGQSDKAILVLRRLWTRELQALERGAELTRWRRPEDFRFGKEIAGAELAYSAS